MYYFYCIFLERCSFSHRAKLLLDKYNIKYSYETVNYEESRKLITDKISTFPQIYLRKENANGSILIGGFTDLNELFNLFHKKEYNEDNVQLIMKKYGFSKKIVLRIIELLNK